MQGTGQDQGGDVAVGLDSVKAEQQLLRRVPDGWTLAALSPLGLRACRASLPLSGKTDDEAGNQAEPDGTAFPPQCLIALSPQRFSNTSFLSYPLST